MNDAHERLSLRDRRLALLTQAEEIAGLGSWEWTPATGELLWSDNHFRLFGGEPRSFTPTSEYVMQRVHPADREHVADALTAMADGTFDDRTVEYRIIHDDGRVHALVARVIACGEDDSGARRIVGAVQDVTLQRRLERRLAAHLAVTQALDEWVSLEQGAQGLLARLAQAMELAFAALWVPDGPALAVRAMWRLPSPAIDPVVASTQRWKPGVHSGGVGRAYATGLPIVVAESELAVSAERRAAMQQARIAGTMLVPAVAADETLAVFELLSFEPVEPTEQLVRALGGIGHEVGQFLSHRRGELSAPVLTGRELEVLQRAALGHPAAQIALELSLSPATVKRHFERAYGALGVRDRASAVGEAMRRGLIT